MKRHSWTKVAALATIWVLCALLAPTPGNPWSAQAQEQAGPADEAQRARDAKIAEYLRKKEERRARREHKRQEQEGLKAEQAAAREQERTVQPQAAAPVAQKKKRSYRAERSSPLPRSLAMAQQHVRMSSLGQDPSVQRYLTMVDMQAASPDELAAFGNFLAQNGLTHDAMEYYAVALRLDKGNPVLWINVGTLHRQQGDLREASSAYARALSIDAGSAVAHYNLGATLDELGKYERAIEEYRQALLLDPNLADPATNPQAVNNDRLLAVKLMIYQEQAGSLGLPLIEIPGSRIDTESSP